MVINPPPIKEALINKVGQISQAWVMFFQNMFKKVEESAEDVETQLLLGDGVRDLSPKLREVEILQLMERAANTVLDRKVKDLEMAQLMGDTVNPTWEGRIKRVESGSMWPVGSVFISVVATDPATLLGFGTWVSIGTGRVLIGVDVGDVDFDTVEKTGGSKTHKHSVDVGATASGAPSATETVQSGAGATVASGTHTHNVDPAAVDTDTVSNVPPYFTVYMWKRTV